MGKLRMQVPGLKNIMKKISFNNKKNFKAPQYQIELHDQYLSQFALIENPCKKIQQIHQANRIRNLQL